jgi:hypothetical protein
VLVAVAGVPVPMDKAHRLGLIKEPQPVGPSEVKTEPAPISEPTQLAERDQQAPADEPEAKRGSKQAPQE